MAHHTPTDPRSSQIFFTMSLRRPGSDLLILEIERLRQAVRLTRAERPFQIDAWVVLPDHLHAIWTLPDADHPARWRMIKSRFSQSLPNRSEHSIWHPRSWAQPIRSVADYDLHKRACQMDPVRHGLVDDAEEWPFSSFLARPALQLAG